VLSEGAPDRWEREGNICRCVIGWLVVSREELCSSHLEGWLRLGDGGSQGIANTRAGAGLQKFRGELGLQIVRNTQTRGVCGR